MVHALHEAHRVLKSDGILIDLRPMPRHRRIGVGEGESWQLVGVMREKFDDDYAADAAVRQVVREGLFRRGTRIEFEVERVMDTVEDFREWLDDFVQLEELPSHAWLIRRVERALSKHPVGTKIVVRGPLRLGLLFKCE